MPKDTVVSISGLKARPDLNGRQGTIEDYNKAVGRYNVKVQKLLKVLGLDASVVVQRFGFGAELWDDDNTVTTELRSFLMPYFPARHIEKQR